jgi:hypothetical protein
VRIGLKTHEGEFVLEASSVKVSKIAYIEGFFKDIEVEIKNWDGAVVCVKGCNSDSPLLFYIVMPYEDAMKLKREVLSTGCVDFSKHNENTFSYKDLCDDKILKKFVSICEGGYIKWQEKKTI